MHGWRHFFKTRLLSANVADSKVMSLTGHASKKMKERYTHFDTAKFTEVIGVREKLLDIN
jgi:integrase